MVSTSQLTGVKQKGTIPIHHLPYNYTSTTRLTTPPKTLLTIDLSTGLLAQVLMLMIPPMRQGAISRETDLCSPPPTLYVFFVCILYYNRCSNVCIAPTKAIESSYIVMFCFFFKLHVKNESSIKNFD